MAELAAMPTASLLFYDPKQRIQISVTGPVTELAPERREQEWQSLHAGSKMVYQIEPAPDQFCRLRPKPLCPTKQQ